MRRARMMSVLLSVSVALLVLAPAALAQGAGENGGGQGWYGETSDKVVTNAMFMVIAFFPAVITLLSLIQWRLDKRKHARTDAAKRRAASADWRGGW